jgi:GT2 family glycosyltransferase
MNSPRIAVILVNYRAWSATLACLNSLALLDYPANRLTVWVVDNGGDNWSNVSQLNQIGPFKVFPLLEKHNLGYSAGNNAAIRQALPQAEAIWLLNNDTLVKPDTLQALVNRWQQAVQKIGKPVLVGGVIHHPDGRFQQVATRVNLWTGSSITSAPC